MPNSETQSQSDHAGSRSGLIPARIWEKLDSFAKNLKSKFIRAFKFVSMNVGHPSLPIEVVKIQRVSVYRARGDPQYRIHFELKDDYYAVLEIGPHGLQGIGSRLLLADDLFFSLIL